MIKFFFLASILVLVLGADPKAGEGANTDFDLSKVWTKEMADKFKAAYTKLTSPTEDADGNAEDSIEAFGKQVDEAFGNLAGSKLRQSHLENILSEVDDVAKKHTAKKKEYDAAVAKMKKLMDDLDNWYGWSFLGLRMMTWVIILVVVIASAIGLFFYMRRRPSASAETPETP